MRKSDAALASAVRSALTSVEEIDRTLKILLRELGEPYTLPPVPHDDHGVPILTRRDFS